MTTLLWSLFAFQLFMGAFDTLYHHEFKERLAWRISQQKEIRLHGIRNFFYAVLFAAFGLFAPHGAFAIALVIILAIEVIITLLDFVEEDKSRKLPGTERVLHTVMALNYGAILILLIPILLELSKLPTRLAPVDHGIWRWMMCISALAVFIFGIRDLHSSSRLQRLARAKQIPQIPVVIGNPNVLITGGTGFIGQALIPALQKARYHVTLLTRDSGKARLFDGPITVVTHLDQITDRTPIDFIINLAGETTASLWTKKQKQRILDSRVNMTQSINGLIARLQTKPRLLVNGSAIGVYGVSPEGECHEDTPLQDDGSFSHKLCNAWEETAKLSSIPTALIRIGIVLDYEGGPLGQMIIPTELGGGAVFGHGRQKMSWITRRDAVRLIGHIMESKLTGPVNLTAPNPVSNKDFTKALSKRLFRPTLVAIPKVVIGLAGDFGKEIFLGDQIILPTKASATGFKFMDPNINEALDNIFQVNSHS